MARSNGANKPIPNLLATLSTVPEAPSRSKSTKRKLPPRLLPGTEMYGAFHRVGKEIDDSFKKLHGQPLRDASMEYYIAEGVLLGRRPDNIDCMEGRVSKASVQLKDKSGQLEAEVVAEFNEIGIPLEEIGAPATMRVRPEVFAANQDLMNEMLACLGRNGYNIHAIFEQQKESRRWLVAPNTVDTIFAKAKLARKDGKKSNFGDLRIKQLLKLCTTMAIAPTWDGTFLEAFEIVRQECAPTEAEKKARAKAKPAAKPSLKTSRDVLNDQLRASLVSEGVEGSVGELYMKPVKSVKPTRGRGPARPRA